MLLNHTYKSFYTEKYHSCPMACIHDSQCTSLNYWWYSSQCDLNNRTKYSAESKFFISDTFSTYMSLTSELGIYNNIFNINNPILLSRRFLSTLLQRFARCMQIAYSTSNVEGDKAIASFSRVEFKPEATSAVKAIQLF